VAKPFEEREEEIKQERTGHGHQRLLALSLTVKDSL
jgi:hypothetical protein